MPCRYRFLYGLSYEDDRLFTTANDVHDLLVEAQIPIYANVISRLELVDLVFRKQVTAGCIAMFNSVKGPAYGKDIFKLLKDIRDKGTAVAYEIRQPSGVRSKLPTSAPSL